MILAACDHQLRIIIVCVHLLYALRVVGTELRHVLADHCSIQIRQRALRREVRRMQTFLGLIQVGKLQEKDHFSFLLSRTIAEAVTLAEQLELEVQTQLQEHRLCTFVLAVCIVIIIARTRFRFRGRHLELGLSALYN